MPTAAGTAAEVVTREVARRWAELDPLLPEPPQVAGCGIRLAVPAAAEGPLAGAGTCEHWTAPAGTLDATWGAACRFELRPQIAVADVRAALDQLLAQWAGHLSGLPAAAQDDTAAVVTWPSRDIEGVRALLDHGLVPRSVIAARLPGRGPRPRTAALPSGVHIRQAGPADARAVVQLGLETIRYDACFGTVIERPDTVPALRVEAGAALAGPDPWIWLAERDARPVGLLYAERPESSGWIAPLAQPAPVSYLELMTVRPEERGSGVGAALVAEFLRIAEAAGVGVTLLHHDQVNPLSGPFWSQRGYRPLWTVWEARPARTLR